MVRNRTDHYPTPPDAVLALVHAVREFELVPQDRLDGLWLEPSCGRGSLLRWFGVPVERWLAFELDETLAVAAEPLAARVVMGDALELDWPSDRSVCDNPPFSAMDAFLRRMLDQVANDNTAICFTRSQYLDEPPRAWLRRPNTRPDFEVKLCWRISFTDDGRGDFATYSWWIWNSLQPKNHTVKLWAERPQIRDKYWDDYRQHVLALRGPVQADLGL